MKHRKMLMVGLLAILFIFGVSLAVAWEISVSTMPKAALGQIYYEQVPLSDDINREDCRFVLDWGELPSGLSLTEDGYITSDNELLSQPGTSTVYIRVYASDGSTTGRYVTVSIAYKTVNITVSSNKYTWEPNGKYQAVFTSDVADVTEGEDFVVTYGSEGLSEVEYPGDYRIYIDSSKLYKKGYKLGKVSESFLTVLRNPDNNISISDKTVNYGETYEMFGNVTVTPEPIPGTLGYVLSYSGRSLSGNSYGPTDVSPTEAGNYRVTATTDDRCYTERSAVGSLVIKPVELDVHIEGFNQNFSSDIKQYKLSVYDIVGGILSGEYYSITYTDGEGNEYKDCVTKPGIYDWKITCPSGNYIIKCDSYEKFVVNAEKLYFDVSYPEDNVYYQGKTHKATVTPISTDTLDASELKLGTDYFVKYYDSKGNEVLEPQNAGEYTVKVLLSEEVPYINGGIALGISNKMTIRKRKINFSYDGPTTVTYNATNQAPIITCDTSEYGPWTEENNYGYVLGFSPENAVDTDAGPQQEIVDAGKYILWGFPNNDNYEFGDLPFETFVIEKAPINFRAGNGSIADKFYTGSEQTENYLPITALFETAGSIDSDDYNVTYTLDGGTTVAAMKNAGTYTVGIELDETKKAYFKNYKVGSITPASLKVLKLGRQITVRDTEQEFSADKSSYAPLVYVGENLLTEGYKITYARKSDTSLQKFDTVTEVGEYYYYVTSTDSNYDFSGDITGDFTVKAKTESAKKLVCFAATDNMYHYDGNPHAAKISAYEAQYIEHTQNWGCDYDKPVALVAGVDYKVGYVKDEINYSGENLPVEIGSYVIEIELLNEEYAYKGITDGSLMIIEPIEIELGGGNSIWKKMTDEEQGVYLTALMYKNKLYNPNAFNWGENEYIDEWWQYSGECPDKSETAYFLSGEEALLSFDCTQEDYITSVGVTQKYTFNDPGFTHKAFYSDGSDATGYAISVWIDENPADIWISILKEKLAKSMIEGMKWAEGVHNITYKYADGTVNMPTVQRALVILPWAVGDANRDRNVNIGDARYIEKVLIPNSYNESGELRADLSQKDRLHLLRVCDVANGSDYYTRNDNKVSIADAKAIKNRKSDVLMSYYE